MARVTIILEDVSVDGQESVAIDIDVDPMGDAGCTPACLYGMAVKKLWDHDVLPNLAPLVSPELQVESAEAPRSVDRPAEVVVDIGAPTDDAKSVALSGGDHLRQLAG